jgi:hypothetical protein
MTIRLIDCFDVATIVSPMSRFLVQGIQGDSFQGLQCNYHDKDDYGRSCTTQISAQAYAVVYEYPLYGVWIK